MIKESTKSRIKSRRRIWDPLSNKLHGSPLICNIFVFCLGVLLAGASFRGSCFMGGVAYVGALGSGISGFVGLIGVFVGYLSSYGFEHSVLYLGSALFAYTIAFLFQYTPFFRSRWFMPPVIFFLIALLRSYGAINVVRGASEQIWEYGFEALVGGGLTYIYSLSLRRRDFDTSKDLYIYSVSALFATALTSFPSVYFITELSPASVAAAILVMAIMYRGYIQIYPIAAMLGVALQFGSTAREGAFVMYMLYSFADVFPLKKNKYLLSLYVLAVVCLLGALYGFSVGFIGQLLEILLASFVFWCLPKKILTLEKSIDAVDANETLQHQALDIHRLSHLMKDICEDLPDITVPKSRAPEMHYVFDRAVEEVCRSCEKKSICWDKQCIDSVSLLHKTTKHITERGKLELEDFPNNFRTHCIRSHSMVLAVNYELRRWFLSEKLLELEHTNTCASKHQYQLFGRILSVLSNRLMNHQVESIPYNQRYSAEIGVASKRKNGEAVCGDSVKYFKTTDGILYVILSDGVGSGQAAKQYSDYAISLMEKGLKLLRDPISVMGLTNLTLQLYDRWAAATIDLLTVNLNSGELTFYKMGACDSFVFTNDKVVVIEGDAYSAGTQPNIEHIQSQTIHLSSETVIVLASDGVSLNIQSTFAQRLFQNQDNMKYTAKQLLLCTENEISDDKTVITILLKERSDAV